MKTKIFTDFLDALTKSRNELPEGVTPESVGMAVCAMSSQKFDVLVDTFEKWTQNKTAQEWWATVVAFRAALEFIDTAMSVGKVRSLARDAAVAEGIDRTVDSLNSMAMDIAKSAVVRCPEKCCDSCDELDAAARRVSKNGGNVNKRLEMPSIDEQNESIKRNMSPKPTRQNVPDVVDCRPTQKIGRA